MTIPALPGWHLIGAYPDPEDDGVGSWLLHDRGEALLLEIPPGLTTEAVRAALGETGTTLRYVTASHDHEDHFDRDTWDALRAAFPRAEFIPPGSPGHHRLFVGTEPLWLVHAPKHSMTDVVTVFRGVAMTGDIELGTLKSVNHEVPARQKAASMARLREFPAYSGYHVHAVVSAHLNDYRAGVNFAALFSV